MNKILHGNALDKLKELDSESIDCCITSPPYWALRDYKTEGQLGLEPTFTEYISKLIEIFNEVKRVLKRSGSCWVNLGDTYSGSGGAAGHHEEYYNKSGRVKGNESKYKQIKPDDIPGKSLCLIPQRFQIAMVDAGWICRNTIIWHKPNCMPSSAKDRFTVDFEYLFFFTKSPRYYFETQYEPLTEITINEMKKQYEGQPMKDYEGNGVQNPSDIKHRMIKKYQDRKFVGNKYPPEVSGYYSGKIWNPQPQLGRLKRCVWKIPTAPFSEAHFAVFPPAIVETPLKSTCPVEGIVLDPFLGSGTVALVALQNARNFIGIELNQSYIDMAMKRLEPYLLQTRLEV